MKGSGFYAEIQIIFGTVKDEESAFIIFKKIINFNSGQ